MEGLIGGSIDVTRVTINLLLFDTIQMKQVDCDTPEGSLLSMPYPDMDREAERETNFRNIRRVCRVWKDIADGPFRFRRHYTSYQWGLRRDNIAFIGFYLDRTIAIPEYTTVWAAENGCEALLRALLSRGVKESVRLQAQTSADKMGHKICKKILDSHK
ncbi:hypothetical protein PROFUN_00502 [Planoprotostelium fungivorum]|uniref:F-box domain-containing protein n=1 Tax=Planoprotostelium fungivorum TaxID=1890364 RepID=A0A2P6N134_9EUKA|nr:hypothetical protein PROFUN_00502 [Planoprotostelium fungivorum]